MLLWQVAQASQRQRAARGGRDAEWKLLPFWKQKSPLESLGIMPSCPGLLPSFPLPIVEQQQHHRSDLHLLLMQSHGAWDKWVQEQRAGPASWPKCAY